MDKKSTLSFRQTKTFLAYFLDGILNSGMIKPLESFINVDIDLTLSINSLFKNISSNYIPVFQWHADTFTLPSDAKVLSISDRYIQAFKFKNAIGLQFHIEVTKPMILSWLEKYDYEFEKENGYKVKISSDIENKVKELHVYSKIVYNNFISSIK